MTDQPKPCDCVLDRIRSKPFSSWSYIEKMEIIQEGRPTPELPAKLETRNSINFRSHGIILIHGYVVAQHYRPCFAGPAYYFPQIPLHLTMFTLA